MRSVRTIEPYGIVLSEAQRRDLASAARGNGMLHWRSGPGTGRGVRGRWNVLHTLEALDLSRLVAADRAAGYYEWELNERGYEIGLKLPMATVA